MLIFTFNDIYQFMYHYKSIHTAIFDLRKRGYRLDFYFFEEEIICFPLEIKIPVKEVSFDEVHTFSYSVQQNKETTISAITLKQSYHGLFIDSTGKLKMLDTILVT